MTKNSFTTSVKVLETENHHNELSFLKSTRQLITTFRLMKNTGRLQNNVAKKDATFNFVQSTACYEVGLSGTREHLWNRTCVNHVRDCINH